MCIRDSRLIDAQQPAVFAVALQRPHQHAKMVIAQIARQIDIEAILPVRIMQRAGLDVRHVHELCIRDSTCAEALGLTAGAAIAPTDTEGFVRAEIHGGGMAENRTLRVLDCGESGSTLRFFIPLALDGQGAVRFEGRGRLMQRPLSVYEDMFKARGILWRHEGDSLTVDGLLESEMCIRDRSPAAQAGGCSPAARCHPASGCNAHRERGRLSRGQSRRVPVPPWDDRRDR